MADENLDRVQRCAIVLGQVDRPTDGVEDYCQYLSAALGREQLMCEIVRVPWSDIGMSASLQQLGKIAADSPETWFLVQYTALAWSKHGFPTRIVHVVKTIKASKERRRCAITFHDYGPYGGTRWIDRVRRIVQVFVMRKLLRLCDVAILTVPRERVPWIPDSATNVVFIPVGANLPVPERAGRQQRRSLHDPPVVAIFSVSGGPHGLREVSLIADTVAYAGKQIDRLRVLVFGRNSEVGGRELKAALSGSSVEVTVLGLISAKQIVRTLEASDVLLFVRGPILSNRGSAIAAIACGLPVIALEGPETAAPITDAGVVLVPEDKPHELGPALLRVLTDAGYRTSLAERSRNAQKLYFSWSAIAGQYAEALRGNTPGSTRHP